MTIKLSIYAYPNINPFTITCRLFARQNKFRLAKVWGSVLPLLPNSPQRFTSLLRIPQYQPLHNHMPPIHQDKEQEFERQRDRDRRYLEHAEREQNIRNHDVDHQERQKDHE